MLTQEQIEKLEPLTLHPKYGKLLKSAISSWKKCKPESRHFGVIKKDNKFCRDKNWKGCCLIGASLLNKKADEDILGSAVKKYKLDEIKEVWDLVYGFDGLSKDTALHIKYEEAYDFSKKVKEVLGC